MKRLNILFISLLCTTTLLFSMSGKPKTESNKLSEEQLKSIESPLETIGIISNSFNTKEQNKIKSQLVSSYMKEGNTEKSITLLKEIEQSRDLSLYINTINSLVSNLGNENRSELINKIINSIQTLDKKDIIIEHITLSAIKNDNISGVLPVIENINSRFIKARVYKHIISYFVNTNQIDKALELYAKVQNSSEKNQVNSLFVIYYASEDNIEEAQNYLNFIPDGQTRELTLSELGKLFAQKQNLNLSIQYTNEIQKTILRDATLVELVKAYVLQKKYKSAFQMSDSIANEGYQSTARTYLANELVSSGQITPALQLANSISNLKLKSEIYYNISLYYAKQNDMKEAFSNLDAIKNEEIKIATVKKLSQYVGSTKDYYFGLLILKKIEPESLKQIALQEFALSFIQHQPIDKSISLLRDIITEETVLQLAKEYISEDRYLDAYDFTERISTKNYIHNVNFYITQASIDVTSTANIQTIIDKNKSLNKDISLYKSSIANFVNYKLYLKANLNKEAQNEYKALTKDLKRLNISDDQRVKLINFLLEYDETFLALSQIELVKSKESKVNLLFNLSQKQTHFSNKEKEILKRIAQQK